MRFAQGSIQNRSMIREFDIAASLNTHNYGSNSLQIKFGI